MPDFSFKDNKFIPIFIIILIGLSIFTFNRMSQNSPMNEILHVEEPPKIHSAIKKQYLYVHVSGSIKKCGVYKMKNSSRLIDAIRCAGGFLENADINSVNLSEIIKDGQKVIIPFLDVNNNPSQNTYRSSMEKVVNLNNADEKLLDSLPGIGSLTAKKIIEYRIANGAFKKIEELKNVSGIGEGKFEKLRKYISL